DNGLGKLREVLADRASRWLTPSPAYFSVPGLSPIRSLRARAFHPHARAKKLPRAAECLVYSLTPSAVLAENRPTNRGFVGILRGKKCLRRGQKCRKRRFFTAISRWRVVSRRALDASGF